MPTISLLKGRERPRTFNLKVFQGFYQDRRWKRLRALKFRNNPLCEKCLERGIVRQTEAAHHVIFIDPYHPNEELIFDYDNLQSLCMDCHNEVHGRCKQLNPIEAQIIQRREVR